MTEIEPVERAREYFLRDDNYYGCAESAFLALKDAYGLDPAGDSSPAMALNGGVAYSGGMCGAISGTALAVGMLAEQRLGDHFQAKRIAREIMEQVIDDFAREHDSVNCRDLIEMDLRAPGEHARFIESGIWRTRCMAQIEFALHALAPLADQDVWARRVAELDGHVPDRPATRIPGRALRGTVRP